MSRLKVQPNLVGAHRVFEAAREAGVRRMVFASSCHTILSYPAEHVVDTTDPVRPANLYGVTKVFGELLGRYHYDRHGMEFVGVRIGTFDTDVQNPFLRSIWLSTAPQKFLTQCAADAGPDRGASEEHIRRRSVTSEQRRAGPAAANNGSGTSAARY